MAALKAFFRGFLAGSNAVCDIAARASHAGATAGRMARERALVAVDDDTRASAAKVVAAVRSARKELVALAWITTGVTAVVCIGWKATVAAVVSAAVGSIATWWLQKK